MFLQNEISKIKQYFLIVFNKAIISLSLVGYGPYGMIIGLITVFDAILTSRQTSLEITVFVWKSDVK